MDESETDLGDIGERYEGFYSLDYVKKVRIYEEVYKLDKSPPRWMHPDERKPLPPKKLKSTVKKAKEEGTLKDMIWRQPTLPKWNEKKGPLDYL